jgi:hypothetical protein
MDETIAEAWDRM